MVVALGLLLLFQAYVPLNMDEFVSYQTLACFSHPDSYPEVGCFPCSSYYLKVLGSLNLPLLTYDYIGSLSSLLYAPVFWIWPEPVSARATGLLSLAVQAWLLSRLFGCRPARTFCCLALFVPYSFVHIADTGPVAFQTTSIYAVAYLLKRWMTSRRAGRRALLLVWAGLLIACGYWVKPTFFFASGGLAVLTAVAFLSLRSRSVGERAQRLAELGLFALCAATPTLLVYQAQRPGGAPYLAVLSTDYVPSQIVLSGLATRFNENVLPFVLNPLAATSSCFDWPAQASWSGMLTGLTGIGVVACGVLTARGRRHRVEIALLGLLFLVSLLLVATNVYAKSMHHAVLAFPFVIMAAARSLGGRRPAGLGQCLLVLFVVMNIGLFFRFPSMHEQVRQAAAPKAFAGPLNADLNASCAEDSVILCADWGLFFIKRLYGPRSQIVLSWCSPDNKLLQDAADIARAHDRDLVVVLLAENTQVRDALRHRFAVMQERTAGGEGSPWRLCKIARRSLSSPPSAAAADPLPTIKTLPLQTMASAEITPGPERPPSTISPRKAASSDCIRLQQAKRTGHPSND